jgi:simple sugar transport system ATP-binding protein
MGFIHSQLVDIRNNGSAVLLISSDLDEVLSLSDRIAVMFEGRINVILSSDTITREDMGLYMSGVKT